MAKTNTTVALPSGHEDMSNIRLFLRALAQREASVESQQSSLGFTPIDGVVQLYQCRRLRRVLEHLLQHHENGAREKVVAVSVRELDDELRAVLNAVTDTVRHLEGRAESAETNLTLICTEDAVKAGVPQAQATEIADARILQQKLRTGWIQISGQVIRVVDPIQTLNAEVSRFCSSMVDGLETNVEEESEAGTQKREGTLRSQFAAQYRDQWAVFDVKAVRLDLSLTALDRAQASMDRCRQETHAFEEVLSEIERALAEFRGKLGTHARTLLPVRQAVAAFTATVRVCNIDAATITIEKDALREADEFLRMAREQLDHVAAELEEAAQRLQRTRALLEVEIIQKMNAVEEKLRMHRANLTFSLEGEVREQRAVKMLALLFYLQGKTTWRESRGISKAVEHLVERRLISPAPFADRVIDLATHSPLFRPVMKYTHGLTEIGVAYAEKWSKELSTDEWMRFQETVREEHDAHVQEKEETKQRQKSRATRIIETLTPLQLHMLHACVAWSEDIERDDGMEWYCLVTAVASADSSLRDPERDPPAFREAMEGLLRMEPPLMTPVIVGKKSRRPGYAITALGDVVLRHLAKKMTADQRNAYHAFRQKVLDEEAMMAVADVGVSSGKAPS